MSFQAQPPFGWHSWHISEPAVLGQRFLSLFGSHAVEHQHTIEVIDFVLEQSAHQIGRFDLDVVAVQPDAAHQHILRTQHFDVQAGNTETPFVVHPFATALDNLWVDDRHGFAVDIPHEDLLLYPNLRSREGNARVAVVQGFKHVVDEAGDLSIDFGDCRCGSFQHRIAEGTDFVGHDVQGYRAMSHYFDETPTAASDRRTVIWMLPDGPLSLLTDHGVFGYDKVDSGTKLLLLRAEPPPTAGTLLDIGCGTGAIAISMARRSPDASVWAIDTNERARTLCRENAERNGVDNVTVAAPNDVPTDLRFNLIWSNPPIRIGKPALHDLLITWLSRLVPQGEAWLTVQKHLGADSLQRWLTEQGFETHRSASSAGFRILRSAARRIDSNL